MILTEEEINKLIMDIFRGAITINNLPVYLHRAIYLDLEKAINQGYGKLFIDVDIESPDYRMMKSLQANTNFFSQAKVYQYVNDNSNLILNKNGFLRPFNDFKNDALKVYDKYNVNWLKTEHDMTIKQADSAAKWVEIQEDKESLPFLQYQTIGDERVRASHAKFDNIVKSVDDPFWNTHNPPLEWGCRCELIQLDEIDGKENLSKDVKTENGKWVRGGKVLDNPRNLFTQNVGKTGQIFKEEGQNKHPYFNVPKKDRKLRDSNFNLPNLNI